MRVGILGAGGIAFGAAAYLHLKGHEPVLWSPSGRSTAELAAGAALKASGSVELSFHPRIASSAEEVITGSDVVMLAMPGNAHRMAMEAIADNLRDGQPTIISSHLSFGALYLSRLLSERGTKAPIIAWGTTLTTGRRQGPTEVGVNSIRSKIDLATVPENDIEIGHTLCAELFGDRFVRRDGLLAISLSNLNPQNHLAISLFNLTRMERGEQWGQAENVTASVGRVMEQLDAERLAIATELGVSVRSIKEHYSFSYQLPIASVAEMNAELHKRGKGGFGPPTTESRYVLEDAPFGLWPTILLGRLAGRPAILHEAGLALLSAAYGRPLADDNDLLPLLEIQNLSRDSLQEISRVGM